MYVHALEDVPELGACLVKCGSGGVLGHPGNGADVRKRHPVIVAQVEDLSLTRVSAVMALARAVASRSELST